MKISLAQIITSVLVLSFVYLYVYYDDFGINIFPQIAPTDLILIAAPHFAKWAVLPMIGLMWWSYQSDKHEKPTWLTFIFYGSAALFYLYHFFLPFHISYLFALLAFVMFAYFSNRHLKEQKELGLVSFITLMFFGCLFIGQLAKADSSLILLDSYTPTCYSFQVSEDEIIHTCDSLFVIGESSESYFIYDNATKKTSILRKEKLQRIDVYKNNVSNRFELFLKKNKED